MGELWGDFIHVFGKSPLAAIRRVPKALAILRSALRAKNVASPQLPLRIQVEVTDQCNYRCIMCNRENLIKLRPKLNNMVGFDLFKKLVDEIRPFYMTLNGLGEPLMNRDIFKILKLSRDKKMTSSMPTNLGFINDDLFEKLVANAPEILTVSIHGATKETYEAITLSRTFDRFLQYFERLIGRLGTDRLRILCALQAKNLHEFDAFYEFLAKWKMLDHFTLLPAYDNGADLPEENRSIPTPEEKARAIHALEQAISRAETEEKRRFLQNWKQTISEIVLASSIHEDGPCLIPWISTYITAKGDVLPCCYLTSEVHVMGNIHEKPFTEIWNGPKYQEFRTRIRDDRAHLEGCKNCPRNDSNRLRRYGFLVGGPRGFGWKKV